jgi:hypothetical protein
LEGLELGLWGVGEGTLVLVGLELGLEACWLRLLEARRLRLLEWSEACWLWLLRLRGDEASRLRHHTGGLWHHASRLRHHTVPLVLETHLLLRIASHLLHEPLLLKI